MDHKREALSQLLHVGELISGPPGPHLQVAQVHAILHLAERVDALRNALRDEVGALRTGMKLEAEIRRVATSEKQDEMITLEEAGRKLREMYDTAPDREQVAHIHLFGIQYADELHGLSNQAIVDQAGIPNTYATEVAKGRKLAKYARALYPA